jgi:hypothetical protein
VRTWLLAHGREVTVDDATATLIMGRPARPGIRASLNIYNPRVYSSSRGMNIGLNLISSDSSGTTASVTSSPSGTLGVSVPAGQALDIVRAQSIQVAGGNQTRGASSNHYSVLRERSRVGTASGDSAPDLTGHEVSAVAVIKVSGPDDERWVVGNVQFRVTEDISGEAEHFATESPTPEGGTQAGAVPVAEPPSPAIAGNPVPAPGPVVPSAAVPVPRPAVPVPGQVVPSAAVPAPGAAVPSAAAWVNPLLAIPEDRDPWNGYAGFAVPPQLISLLLPTTHSN